MNCYSEEFRVITERKFIKFLLLTIKGLKLDYLKHINRQKNIEVSAGLSEDYLWGIADNQGENLKSEILNELLSAVNKLSPREKFVICKTVISDMTEANVAVTLHITQQGVHKIKRKALKKLYTSLKEVL